MVLSFPCRWDKYDANSNLPTLIQQFVYKISDSISIGVSLDISKLKKPLTNLQISKITSEKFLIENFKPKGSFIASERLIIGGHTGDKVTLKIIKGHTCIYEMVYHLYKGDIAVTITYIFVSETLNNAYANFKYYSHDFKKMANRTEFLN